MSTSLNQPPHSTISQSADPTRGRVRRVAKYQRIVIFALLASIITNILVVATVGQAPTIRLVILVLSLSVAIFAMVAVFFLAKEVMNTVLGVLCAVLMVVPFISLIALLVVNQKATSYLQRNGVRVGFFGTDPNRL